MFQPLQKFSENLSIKKPDSQAYQKNVFNNLITKQKFKKCDSYVQEIKYEFINAFASTHRKVFSILFIAASKSRIIKL